MRVLLVDDEGLTREGLSLLIQVTNPAAQVTAVGSIAEALDCVGRDEFDFIFLDIQLDGESGLSLLDRLKAQEISSPVIMLSSHDDRDTILDSLSRGAFGFVPKHSESAAVIRQAMDLALRGGVYLPPSVREHRGTTPRVPIGTAFRPLRVSTVGPADLQLSPRVYEALFYVSQGLTNKAIGRKMSISEHSVAEYVKSAFLHLNVVGRQGFMVLLNRSGWQMVHPTGSPDSNES